MRRVYPALALAIFVLPSPSAALQTLRGSSESMARQNAVANEHDYTFLRTSSDVRRFTDLGLLEPLRGNGHYELAAVSHPVARPAVRTFIERLSAQYVSACGEKLVVTSLTRPTAGQPRNASDQSVHPAGMAVDLRISNKSKCRSWLERTLLSLEKTGLLDVTRERRPAHYHIAIYPSPYIAYVDRLESRNGVKVAAAAPATRVAEPSPAASGPSLDEAGTADYRVNRGDTLWSIARRHQTTVTELKQLNGLRSSRIAAGQVIVVPAGAH
jgi:LysM repeat protein